MKKNSTLSDKLKKRLKAYSLTAGALAAGVTGADAQILYTDVDPDAEADGVDSVFLDLNADGIDDFKFYVNNGATASNAYNVYRAFASARNNNAIVGTYSSSGGYSYPYAVNAGDTINESLTFQNGTFQTIGWDYFYYTNSSTAPFTFGNVRWGSGDQYLGLRLEVDGNTHYGWARIELDNTGGGAGVMILKDYALELTPDLGIPAGDTAYPAPPAGIADQSELGYNMFATGNEIRVNATETIDRMTVTSVGGKVVAQLSDVRGNKTVQLGTASGVYFVRVETAKGTRVEKFYID